MDQTNEKTLSDMKPGETGWTMPWCMNWADEGSIHMGYTVMKRGEAETATMKVQRTIKGYRFDLSGCEKRYRRDAAKVVGLRYPAKVVFLHAPYR